MEHDGKSRRWRVPRVLGVAALAAGLLAVGLPAGQALASTAHATPAASTATQYSLNFVGSAKALGHSWIVDFSAGDGSVGVLLSTSYKGVTEQHEWQTTTGFAPTAAKELKVTSTGHASFNTGKALSPVLAAAVTFTPTKATKGACTKGSETIYTGKASGALTLVTGLKKVKVALKFAGKAGASLDVDKSCQPKLPPVKTPCTGGSWFVAASAVTSNVLSEQELGKSAWLDVFAQGPFRDGVQVGDPLGPDRCQRPRAQAQHEIEDDRGQRARVRRHHRRRGDQLQQRLRQPRHHVLPRQQEVQGVDDQLLRHGQGEQAVQGEHRARGHADREGAHPGLLHGGQARRGITGQPCDGHQLGPGEATHPFGMKSRTPIPNGCVLTSRGGYQPPPVAAGAAGVRMPTRPSW